MSREMLNKVDDLVEELSFLNGGMYWYDHRQEYELIQNELCKAEMGGMNPNRSHKFELLADELQKRLDDGNETIS